jgi:transposase
MLIMETRVKIRLRYHVKKHSISQISRELKLSRNTVKRVLREENSIDKKYKRDSQPFPRLGHFKSQLEDWLTEESKLSKSERCSSRKLHQRLKSKGYLGSYDSIQRFVKQWHLESGKVGNAYIPLSFAPGEAYQFDWSEETVELGGIVQKVKVAHFRLCHSRLFYMAAYPRETQEMLFDAHDKAFTFFNGIPLRGIYDNMKTAVDMVFVGKERKFNRRFLEMQNHYLVEPTACSPAAGWEKGQVENQVGNMREWVFVPRLSFASLSQLNAHLEASCLEQAKIRKHPDYKTVSIHQVFEEQESSLLRPLMPPFEGYNEHSYKVSSTCLVGFDRNRYSVDCRYANHVVSLRAYASRIVIVAEGKTIATHERHFGRDKTLFDPWHYVPLLQKKPGALRNGAPFQNWELPTPLQKVRRHLTQRSGGDRECVQVLLAIGIHGLEIVTVACELALQDKVISADYILNLIGRLPSPVSCQPIQTPDTLKLTHEPVANCTLYNALLTGGVSYATH